MRHYALAGSVLVDETVVWSAVWTVGEDSEVVKALEDGLGEPWGKRGREEGVVGGESGRIGLEATVR